MSTHGLASAFKGDVDRALVHVARLLEQERRPVYPSGVAHRFDDKYLLVQVSTNAGIAAQLNALELFLGVDRATLDTLQGWGRRRAVTLRFEWERTCAFSRKATREVEGATRTVKRSIFGGTTVKKSKRYIRVVRGRGGVGGWRHVQAHTHAVCLFAWLMALFPRRRSVWGGRAHLTYTHPANLSLRLSVRLSLLSSPSILFYTSPYFCSPSLPPSVSSLPSYLPSSSSPLLLLFTFYPSPPPPPPHSSFTLYGNDSHGKA